MKEDVKVGEEANDLMVVEEGKKSDHSKDAQQLASKQKPAENQSEEEPAGINAINIWKITPLNIALLKNHTGCIKRMFHEDGVNVNVKDEKGRSFLHLSLIRIDENTIEFVNLLLVKGADPNIKD